ncbi:hypothetical protein [Pleomorphomonas oryzae]|uniref:hypothetical protein n=1 Tax=Pleomorphomonas oryzae TaxID=261934 RepID=UPI00040C2510|nr:hypothetical protein [Pleomorphomonas oryzae]
MRWLINKDGVNTGESYDDGIIEPMVDGHGPGPGDDGFTRDGIDAELKRRNDANDGHTYTADYQDVTWPPPTDLQPPE